jgi:MFS family permease
VHPPFGEEFRVTFAFGLDQFTQKFAVPVAEAVSMGLGQIVVGPISDMIGRKPPIYIGLGVFIVGSIGCAFAPEANWLILFRFLQGAGACPGMVVPRAIVRDLHTGNDAARLMSLLMLVFSVSPILEPRGALLQDFIPVGGAL